MRIIYPFTRNQRSCNEAWNVLKDSSSMSSPSAFRNFTNSILFTTLLNSKRSDALRFCTADLSYTPVPPIPPPLYDENEPLTEKETEVTKDKFSDVYQTPPVASMEMLHAQTDLIESMQNFLKKYDHIPHNEKSIKLLLAEEKFLKIKQVVEEEQTQPEYLQELLQSLLTDLQILNEIQPLKQETLNQIQKDQEEKSIVELLAEERLQKANQVLNESQSPQEMRIQDLEIQKQQCLEEIKEWMNDLGIREYQKEEIDIDYRRKCEDKIYELKDKFNGLSIEIRKIIQEAEELRESEARARSQKIIIDDDDDDLGFYAVHPNTIHTPVSQNVEPKDSLIMGDGHINTTPETETISVETLVSNPSESDDFSLGECNLFDIDDSYYEKSTSRLAHLAPRFRRKSLNFVSIKDDTDRQMMITIVDFMIVLLIEED
ncbi:hypothetical protein Tco_1229488 [Tanacetum coccineum]